MIKFFKIILEFILLLANCLAFWDIYYRSEEALKLEYTLIIVSLLYLITLLYLVVKSKSAILK